MPGIGNSIALGFGGSINPAIALLSDGNTVGWYDYMVGVTKDVNNKVSLLADILGSGHDLKNAYAPARPTWSTNGIVFNPANFECLITDAFTLNQPEFVYIVFRQITWTLQGAIFDGIYLNGTLFQYASSPYIAVNAGAYSTSSDSLALNTWGIVRVLINGASSKMIINNGTPITGNFGAGNMGGFAIGANGVGGFNWANIEVKEVILRNVADSAGDEAILYNYLKTKYSL